MSAQSLILIRQPKIVQTGFVFYLSTFVGVEICNFSYKICLFKSFIIPEEVAIKTKW